MDPVNIPAKFEVCSFTRSWDNRGCQKNLGRLWIRPWSLFSKIFHGLVFGWTLCMYRPNLQSVALAVPEIIGGTRKIRAIPEYAHSPFSSKIFKGLLFGWTLWIHLPNLKFVALPIPEIIGIIGSTQKIWAVPGYAHTPFSPKFFMGLCSDGPCACIAKFAVRSFSHSWDNRDCSFGVGLRTPNLHVPLGLRGWPLGDEGWRCWSN